MKSGLGIVLVSFLLFLVLVFGNVWAEFGTARANPECMEILDMLSTIEGFDYGKIKIAASLFGNEKINLEVSTWRGKCYYGIGTLDGRVVIVSNKPFKEPTLLAFTDSKLVKMLFKEPKEELFEWAISTGRIRIEGAGFINGIKVGLISTFKDFFVPQKRGNATELNLTMTFLVGNLSSSNDLDGDGVNNSKDECDPYLLMEERGGGNAEIDVHYYVCPSMFSTAGELYSGSAPYIDIYDHVMSNGCGVKDTDGGIRYYEQGAICIENVSYSPPRMIEGPAGPRMLRGEYLSECKKKYVDYCLDEKTLVEYYYEPPKRVMVNHPLLGSRVVYISERIRSITYECPLGCEAGACVCEDFDAAGFGTREERGKNLEKRGFYDQKIREKLYFNKSDYPWMERVRYYSFAYSDICYNETHYLEYYMTVESPSDPFQPDRCLLKAELIECPFKPSSLPMCDFDNHRCDSDKWGKCAKPEDITNFPQSFDLKNYMTPVKDQGACGSCWAFSTVAAIEGQYHIENGFAGEYLDLSEQYLVSDCYPDGGCDGHWPGGALNFIMENPIILENCFPYDISNLSCNPCTDITERYNVTEHENIDMSNISEIKSYLMNNGPIIVCGAGHCVLLVGWDRDGWIVKNSWGSGWGNYGYGTLHPCEAIQTGWMQAGRFVQGVKEIKTGDENG